MKKVWLVSSTMVLRDMGIIAVFTKKRKLLRWLSKVGATRNIHDWSVYWRPLNRPMEKDETAEYCGTAAFFLEDNKA